MRVNAIIFAILGVFFTIVTVVYWVLSGDPTGTTALAFCIGLSGIIGYYMFFLNRRLPDQPEDSKTAEVSDGAGELGFFSPHSAWPITLAGAASVTVLGLIFGVWLAIIGVFLILWAAVGFLFEYYKHRPRDEAYEARQASLHRSVVQPAVGTYDGHGVLDGGITEPHRRVGH